MEVNSWIAAPETNRRLIEIPIKPAVRPSLAGIAIAAHDLCQSGAREWSHHPADTTAVPEVSIS